MSGPRLHLSWRGTFSGTCMGNVALTMDACTHACNGQWISCEEHDLYYQYSVSIFLMMFSPVGWEALASNFICMHGLLVILDCVVKFIFLQFQHNPNYAPKLSPVHFIWGVAGDKTTHTPLRAVFDPLRVASASIST